MIPAGYTLETMRLDWSDPAHRGPRDYPVLRWQGSYSRWCELVRGLVKTSRHFRENLSHKPDSWAGFERQSSLAMVESGLSTDALASFDKALATLKADNLLAGRLAPAVAGGAWIVPLVLANNPMPARLRQRTKLPPKRIDVSISTWGGCDADAISASMAKIAKAAWGYILAGGAIDLTVHYCYFFHEGQTYEGARATVASIKVPLTSCAALASAASVQLYRSTGMGTRYAIQGHDGASPPVTLCKPGIVHLDGTERDAARIAALQIEG